MMRRTPLFLFSTACLCLYGIGYASAQEAAPATTATNSAVVSQVPRLIGPPVAKPPPYARWIVRREWGKKLDQGADNPFALAAPPGPKSIEYLKGPNVARKIIHWSKGGETVLWYYDRIVMEKFAKSGSILVKAVPFVGENEDANEAVGDVSTERFFNKYPGFEWVRAEHFVGEEERNGMLCLHFKDAVAGAQIDVKLTEEEAAYFDEMDRMVEEEAKAGGKKGRKTARKSRDRLDIRVEGFDREAWVTAEGRWPVALRDGSVLMTFQHQEPPVPGAFPRMGPEFETLLAEFCQTWNLPPPKY